MGVATLFLGFIKEAWPGTSGDIDEKQRKLEIEAAIQEQTDRVLGNLPDKDEWPPLCKTMFAYPPAHADLITYEHRLIHFAASMKNVDFALRDWLDKFEALLKQLYWDEVFIRIDAGYLGEHTCKYTPKKEWLDALYRGWLTPITDWDFATTLEQLESLSERTSIVGPVDPDPD